jgi:hypothetical protein
MPTLGKNLLNDGLEVLNASLITSPTRMHNFKRSWTLGWMHGTLYRKSDLCIPRNETERPHPYIHLSMRDLHIPRVGLPIWMKQNRQTDPGNI